MIIHLAAGGDLRLDAADDFTGFQISGTRPASPEALAAVGVHFDDDLAHAWVDADTVRRLAAGDGKWERGFAAMVAYAAGKGWTDALGRLRAHTEWSAEHR